MVLRKILLLTTVVAFFFTQADAINLGGTEVPKDKFIVYLLIGHSQMAGIITTGNDNVTDPHAWVYRWATTKTWELAKETGSLRNGLSGRGTGGPGMPFLKQMVSRHSGYYFGVVTNADPSATCRGLNTGSNGSTLSDTANRYWRDAQLFHEIVNAARDIKQDVTLGGILCMLGSVEATRADSVSICNRFSNDIAQMAKDMRDSIGIPNLPFVVADYEKGASGDFNISNPWPAIIAKQLDSVTSKLSYSVEVNSGSIPMFDDHHFTIAGEGEWASRAVDSMEAKNFFPPFGSGVTERPSTERMRAVGAIVVSDVGGSVKVDYRPLAGNEAVLSIFNLQGNQIFKERIIGTGGTISTAVRTGGGCFIATINEANYQSTAKFYSAR